MLKKMYLGEFQGEVSNLFWADHSGRTIVSAQRADIELFAEEGQGEEGFKQYRHFQLIIFWVSFLIAEIPNNLKLTHVHPVSPLGQSLSPCSSHSLLGVSFSPKTSGRF